MTRPNHRIEDSKNHIYPQRVSSLHQSYYVRNAIEQGIESVHEDKQSDRANDDPENILGVYGPWFVPLIVDLIVAHIRILPAKSGFCEIRKVFRARGGLRIISLPKSNTVVGKRLQ